MDKLINLSVRAKQSFGIDEEEITEEILQRACGKMMEISGIEVKYKIDITQEDMEMVSKYIDSRMVDVYVDDVQRMFPNDVLEYAKAWQAPGPIPINILSFRECGDELKNVIGEKSVELQLYSKESEELTREEYMDFKQKYNIGLCSLMFEKLEWVEGKEFLEGENVRIFYKNSAHPEKNLETVKLASQKLDELTYGVEEMDSEVEKFFTIYKRISENIVYDYAASDTIIKLNKGNMVTKEEHDIIAQSQNLSGLVNQTTVCAGFSRILQAAMEKVGIEAKYITGKTETERDSYHAWNQVKIDGVWYNTDVTWDRDDILLGETPKNCLKSDKEFVNHVEDENIVDKQICANSKEHNVITDFFEIEALEFQKEEYTSDQLMELLPELNKKSEAGIKLVISKQGKNKNYSIGIGNKLSNECAKWTENKMSMQKEEMTQFIKQFTDKYEIIEKESVFYRTEEGLELVIPGNQLKKDLASEGMDFDEMLVPDDYNKEADYKAQMALTVRKKYFMRNFIYRVRQKISKIVADIRSKVYEKKNKDLENTPNEEEKLKSWDLRNWESYPDSENTVSKEPTTVKQVKG
ncbi:MAG: transglutaminase domain-containing protein, partial [Eubacteriales bacterium]